MSGRAWTVAIALAFVLLIMVLNGAAFVLESAFLLLTGWILFLWEGAQKLQVSWPAIATAAAASAALLVLLHDFCSWLWRTSAASPRPWRRRWTAGAAGLLALAFCSGMAMIGLVHQAAWLATAPEGVLDLVGPFRELDVKQELVDAWSEPRKDGTAASLRRRLAAGLPHGAVEDFDYVVLGAEDEPPKGVIAVPRRPMMVRLIVVTPAGSGYSPPEDLAGLRAGRIARPRQEY